MAAPPTDRPVTVTVGIVWRFQVKPPAHRLPRISIPGATVVALIRLIFGVVYFNDCPQQPNIPNYLIGMAFFILLTILFVTLPERYAAQPRQPPNGFKACVMFLYGLFGLTWILAGDVWIFSVYQPNYDPTAAGGLYCNKTLYTFALWNAVCETFVLFMMLANYCKGLLCCVMMSPAPANGDFYRSV